MPKPKQTTKKAVRTASRARRIAHPPLSTFNGTFVPSNAWHVKLGIDDGRAAVVFVVVIGVLLLGLIATVLGWAKTVTDLRVEVVALRAEITKLKENQNLATKPYTILLETTLTDFGIDQQKIVRVESGTGKRTTLISNVRLALRSEEATDWVYLSSPLGSNAVFFTTRDPIEGRRPIYRFDLHTNSLTKMDPAGLGVGIHKVSPDGHLVAKYDNFSIGNTYLEILDLDTDRPIGIEDPEDRRRGETLCELSPKSQEIEWIGPTALTVQICKQDAQTKLRKAIVNIKR